MKKNSIGSIPIINSIQVNRLFDEFSYDIKPMINNIPEHNNLMLLYGENGCGKTTILNIIYHLLHPEPFRGHRSLIGKIPFESFLIKLNNGNSIFIKRLNNDIVGDYTCTVFQGKKAVINWKWVGDSSSPEYTDKTDIHYGAYCEFLSKLGIAFRYLDDTRKIETSDIMLSKSHRAFAKEEELLTSDRHLIHSINGAITWFRQSSIAATNVGYTTMNSIYTDIINRVIAEEKSEVVSPPESIDELIKELSLLEEKNKSYALFGLTSELDIHQLTTTIRRAGKKHFSTINKILQVYLEIYSTRLEALKDLQKVMNGFVSLLMDFYSHKKVKMDLQRGLQISTTNNTELDPRFLSSGEKQLLLLFCNAISCRSDKTVLIIDEPEISLNSVWQRNLVGALLTCLEGTDFQLIMATHSIEILSRYDDCVVKLDNSSKGE